MQLHEKTPEALHARGMSDHQIERIMRPPRKSQVKHHAHIHHTQPHERAIRMLAASFMGPVARLTEKEQWALTKHLDRPFSRFAQVSRENIPGLGHHHKPKSGAFSRGMKRSGQVR